ncbi:MAG: hypothetical protein ACJAZO_002993 [Myxococcota bacterium]|jgi:hypothetical protein
MRRVVLSFAVVLLGACEGESCDSVEDRAVAAVRDIVDQDQSCTVDADCVVVAIHGRCFDVCTRVVATSNEAALRAAIDAADADICSDYGDCNFIVLPCDAPAAPRCGDGGQCE